jgi:hypothetical protein
MKKWFYSLAQNNKRLQAQMSISRNNEQLRPKLDKTINLEDFEDFYWFKQELISFCATKEIKTSGG